LGIEGLPVASVTQILSVTSGHVTQTFDVQYLDAVQVSVSAFRELSTTAKNKNNIT